jgi:DNA-binding transcriptional MocR family regulator
MKSDHPSARWLGRVGEGGAPLYLAIVRALDGAIAAGELQAGDRLPPQRDVAAMLGIDFTTVTRAYAAARGRGLVEATVGRGTFVRARAASDDAGLVDLSMNLPPPPAGLSLANLLRETTAQVLQRSDPAALLAYHPGAGALGQKAAGAAWLAPCLGDVAAERVLVAAGAQTAIAATLAALCRPGDAVLAEPLTYPGFKTAAVQLGLRPIACASDGEGVMPDALERACREHRPSALYVLPTMQNPTATTLSVERRRAVARVAKAHDVWIIEDDPYARLMDAPPPAVATFAPDRTVFIATLSKCLTPGLRLAFVVAPEALRARLEEALRALSLMPAPLMAAVLTAWIREGQAEAILAGVRTEARQRRAMAATLLPGSVGSSDGLHVWLPLPPDRSPDALRLAAREKGLALVTADAFAIADAHPNGARISLGGASKRTVLAKALTDIADVVRGGAGQAALVV